MLKGVSPMISLQNVSKFYYGGGTVSAGIVGVSLNFGPGEFVLVTGESGSGKSTLLNVLSGVDSYEEGEMLVTGEPTSHYSPADWGDYRRRYIGNIFQDYRLVENYTALENVELPLLLSGKSAREAKRAATAALRDVGMENFSGARCQKLSGGQKQRVAIARALVTDPPVLVADEPTGNLDSSSAAEVIAVLAKVARDKLVILVTHSPEQAIDYATREIRMRDGRVAEDKILRPVASLPLKPPAPRGSLGFGGKLRLGIRSAAAVPGKFSVILAVFLVVALSVTGAWTSFHRLADEESWQGYSGFFSDSDSSRIVVKKADGSAISGEDFVGLEALPAVDRILRDDLLTDYGVELMSDSDWLYGKFRPLGDFAGEVTLGRMPEAENEVLFAADDSYYYFDDDTAAEALFATEFSPFNDGSKDTENFTLKVTGLVKVPGHHGDAVFYAGDEILARISERAVAEYNSVKVLFAGETYWSRPGNPYFFVTPSDKVPAGGAYVSTELDDFSEKGDCRGMPLSVGVENPYFADTLNLTVSATYSKSNFSGLLGEEYSEGRDGWVYINSAEYSALLDKGVYQSSLYLADKRDIDATLAKLKEMGYSPVAVRDTLRSYDSGVGEMLSLARGFALVLLIVALFFISYFVIKLALSSRASYYTTLRTLGASRRTVTELLVIELLFAATVSFAVFALFAALTYTGVIPLPYIRVLISYLKPWHYVALYAVCFILALLLGLRYSRKLFRGTVAKAGKEA